MKQILWTVGGLLSATLAWSMMNRARSGWAGSRRGRGPKVDELAGQLQQAWADHHTVA